MASDKKDLLPGTTFIAMYTVYTSQNMKNTMVLHRSVECDSIEGLKRLLYVDMLNIFSNFKNCIVNVKEFKQYSETDIETMNLRIHNLIDKLTKEHSLFNIEGFTYVHVPKDIRDKNLEMYDSIINMTYDPVAEFRRIKIEFGNFHFSS